MIAKLNTAPTAEPVTLNELKLHLRISTSVSTEDDLLNELIKAARLQVEEDTRRKMVNQTWEYYLQGWPSSDRIKLPFGWLQSVTSVSWKDTDGTETTLTVTTDYLVETNNDQCGYIVLPYGGTWPTGTLYPSNPIKIVFVCGYGAGASSVPVVCKQAIKRACANMYESRGEDGTGNGILLADKTYDRLIAKVPILWDYFDDGGG